MSNEELVIKIQRGNMEYMQELYMNNIKFIRQIIIECGILPEVKYINGAATYNPEYEEALQNAYIGLNSAVNGFDCTKEYKFLTYAKYHIAAAVRRLRLTHNTHRQQELYRRFLKTQQSLLLSLQRMPTKKEIAASMQLNIAEVDYIIMANSTPKSIYEPVTDELLLSDIIQDDCINIENQTITDILYQSLHDAVEQLPPQEAKTIKLYFYMNFTFEQTGEHMGITAAEVRSLCNKALRKLRSPRIRRRIDITQRE